MLFRDTNGNLKQLNRHAFINNTEYFEAITFLLTKQKVTTNVNQLNEIKKLISSEN